MMIKPSSSAVRIALSIAVLFAAAFVSDANAADFSDRDLLVDTFSLDEQAPLAEAEAELAVATEELAGAQEEFDAAEDAFTEASDALAVAVADYEAAKEVVENSAAPTEDELAAMATAEAAVTAAEDAVAVAEAELDAAAVELAAKQVVFDEKLAAVNAILDELALTEQLVGELSEEQVAALNRALHNAIQTGLLPLDLDSHHLQAVLDGHYGNREIQALITAYEQEARFLRIAQRFADKAAETEEDKFLHHADRAAAKAGAEKDKFLGKLERFEEQNARKEARRESHEDHGKHLAKGRNR
jgi:hypothetical protein